MIMPRRPPKRAPQKTSKAADMPIQQPLQFDDDKMKQLFSTMLGCRMATERARLLVKQDKLPADLGVAPGQEAAEVGALIDLESDDCVALGRRDVTARFIRAIPLKTIFTDLYVRRAGSGDGFARPKRGDEAHDAMIAPAFSLSAQLNLLTGVAWSLKRHGKTNVAVAFSGDDSASLTSWRDAVRFSELHKLPIVHIVYNNAGDGSVRSAVGLTGEDSSASLPVFTVDGNDVVAVYRVAQEAIRRARQGYGPALIECQTYRWHSQLGADAPSVRPGGGQPEPSADPLAYMETYLRQKGLWSDKWKLKLAETLAKKIDQAVDFAEKSLQPRKKRTQSQVAAAK